MSVNYLRDELITWIRSTYFPQFDEQAYSGLPGLSISPAFHFDYQSKPATQPIFDDAGQIRMEVAWIFERTVKNISGDCPMEIFFDKIFALIQIEQRSYLEQHGDTDGMASRAFLDITEAINLTFRTRCIRAC